MAPTYREAQAHIIGLRDRIVTQLAESEQRLAERRDVLRGAHAAELALGMPGNRPREQVVRLDREIAGLRREVAEMKVLLEGAERSLVAPAPPSTPHAHLTHRAVPMGQDQLVHGRLLRVWTAGSASIGLLVLGILMLNQLASLRSILWLAGAMILVEALLRRRLVPLVGAAVVVLAILGIWGVVSIVLGHLEQAIGALLVIGALYMALSTVREASR